jgi:hypothetical protein
MKFDPKEFTSTKWHTAEDKAKFAMQFVRFVDGGFQEKQFTDGFYKRLSNMFGHIAHFNRGGFYGTFFTSLQARLEFLEQCANWSPCGDPAWTWSDVERALQGWMRETDAVGAARKRFGESAEKAERAQLRALAKKYPDEVGR